MLGDYPQYGVAGFGSVRAFQVREYDHRGGGLFVGVERGEGRSEVGPSASAGV